MKRLTSLLVLLAVLLSAIPVAAQDPTDSSSNKVFIPLVAGGSSNQVDSAAANIDLEQLDAVQKGKKLTSNAYIVQMIENPVVAYDGNIQGLKATKPQKGQKINPNSADVVKYVAYLDGRHNNALNAVGGGRKLYDYRYAFNGFAAELSPEQAEKIATVPGVIAVTRNELMQLDTSSTPSFLKMNAAGGIWSQLSGNADGSPIVNRGPNSSGAGEGIIVGIIDSGIWPENASFSDRDASGKLVFQQIPGWHGKCTPGEGFTASNCNQKLIGAQWFNAGYGGDAAVKAAFPYEFASARDADGHGSHTASTAAGNYGVNAVVEGVSQGSISGMAPRARIATYKVCWGNNGEGGCFPVDSVAAIDQAVADGVDVLNFSISGSTTNFLDPVEVAFLFAADAGVFVAASAGNSGPTASTVAHNSPWLTTVAAGTHDRGFVATVTLGNGAIYSGVGLGTAVPSSPLVLAADAGLNGVAVAEANLCFLGTLDPAKVSGKIVVCDRGVNARTEKSLEVKQAGGVGMILINPSANSLNADLHFVPTVHLPHTDRAAVRAYAVTSGATAALGQGQQVLAAAPDVATFSSRGPANAGAGDLLKPDIMGPGVDILAAVSPIGYRGRNYDLLSGTSMSSPHLAGIGALMKQKYPNWSPAAIKSALMTTASQVRNNGTPIDVGVFGYGAGHVVPNSAVNPGLVYDAGWIDWLGFLCGTGQLTASYCPSITIDPSNLNYPSIAIGSLAGSQTLTRKVTNVGGVKETYTASISGLDGINVSLPAPFTINPGQTIAYNIGFTTAGATLNAYAQGFLILTGDKGHVVKSPIAVRPVALAAPAEVNGSYDVTFGYTGPFAATGRGLVPSIETPGTVGQDPDQNFSPSDTAGYVAIPVVIPAGTTYARYSLFDADVSAGTDLDLYVYQGSTLVRSSGNSTSNEEANIAFTNPSGAPIALTVYVHGWGIAGGTTSSFKLHEWYVGTTLAGNMTVSGPSSATLGSTGTINLTFSGLTPGVKYLGTVVYSGAAGLPARTVVRVDGQ